MNVKFVLILLAFSSCKVTIKKIQKDSCGCKYYINKSTYITDTCGRYFKGEKVFIKI